MFDMASTTAKRPTRYPVATSMMLSQETMDAVNVTASENGVSKGDVIRDWLEAGRTGRPTVYTDES